MGKLTDLKLVEITKEAMGYKENAPSCLGCQFNKELEDLHIDRSWYNVCTYSNICNFRISASGHCNNFKQK